ncbi:TylF/MycF family methyltransferase [Agrobacterium pusense]|uniref:TylF/MycF family methyltransferase n=1 Tax=Agrobacterium pusense TaxID=648995 RepID=UPI0021D39D95|nr:TylF/MycF family methyltransferase [Agrobacterium pusense]UXT92366.1 hypothetical protein FY130_21620 [Agrobacterium pusense]
MILTSKLDWNEVRNNLDKLSTEVPMARRVMVVGAREHIAEHLGADYLANLPFPVVSFEEALPELEVALADHGRDEMLVVFIEEIAQTMLPLVGFCVDYQIRWVALGGHGTGGYRFDDPMVNFSLRESFHEQQQENFLKIDDPGTLGDFVNLCQALSIIQHLEGDIVECGCFNGSSGGVILDYYNRKGYPRRNFYFFDVFSGFDYDAAYTSTDTRWADSHQSAGYDIVRQRLERKCGINSVTVKKQNIITDDFLEGIDKIAMANLDVDLYEAVDVGLRKLAPKIVKGGLLICEDAGHTPALIGARLALQRFMDSDLGRDFLPVFMESGQVFLIRL